MSKSFSTIFLKLQPKVEKLQQKIPLPKSWSKPAAEVATGGRVSDASQGQVRVSAGVGRALPVKPDKPPEIYASTATEVHLRMSLADAALKKMTKSIGDDVFGDMWDDLENTKRMPDWRPRDPRKTSTLSTVRIRNPPRFSKP